SVSAPAAALITGASPNTIPSLAERTLPATAADLPATPVTFSEPMALTSDVSVAALGAAAPATSILSGSEPTMNVPVRSDAAPLSETPVGADMQYAGDARVVSPDATDASFVTELLATAIAAIDPVSRTSQSMSTGRQIGRISTASTIAAIRLASESFNIVTSAASRDADRATVWQEALLSDGHAANGAAPAASGGVPGGAAASAPGHGGPPLAQLLLSVVIAAVLFRLRTVRWAQRGPAMLAYPPVTPPG
ncbi:MAG: hypothetical protein ACYDCQ_15800, partial [Dehalococcoidia bacterium]